MLHFLYVLKHSIQLNGGIQFGLMDWKFCHPISCEELSAMNSVHVVKLFCIQAEQVSILLNRAAVQ